LAGQFLRSPFFEFHRGFVLRKSLKEPIDIPALRVAVSIRQATLDDLALLETIVSPLRVKRFAKKMQAGEICAVALQEQKVVAYIFAGLANTPSTEDARLKLGPREAYLWAAYALPQYRRQGVVGAVNLNLCRLLQEKGCESVVLFVDMRNRSSLGHCYKIGYCVTDRVTYLRVLKWGMSRCVPIEEPARGRATERV
jgi:ribosomal protein S18 acetylase RimI-like enzyme